MTQPSVEPSRIAFIEKKNEAAAVILSCLRQNLAFTAAECTAAGITALPYPMNGAFRILMAEAAAERPYDFVIFSRRMREAGGAVNGASPESLRPILYENHPMASLPHHIRAYMEADAAHRLHELGQDLIARSLDHGLDSAALVAHARQVTQGISLTRETSHGDSLTFRRPEELTAMAFDDSDIVLAESLLALGQGNVIAAAPGVGKSRLLLQLAACVITGRPFLGIEVKSNGWPFLIFQTENSNRRLNFDLTRIKNWLGPGDFHKFNQRCMIHTLETDDDSMLNIENGKAIEGMQKAIKEHPSQIVVFDPLNAFTTGNLNQDQDMRAVIMRLASLAREGDTSRIPILLHHALTGAAGASRATGYDRASFGRNSKALLGWARSQINLAPANADDNSKLVVACGKNSNGREFAPFGVYLDEDTMIYELDSDFNIDEWQKEVAGKKTEKREKCSSERIAELLRPLQPSTKTKLVNEVMQKTNLKIAMAYRAIDKAMKDNAIRMDEGEVFYYSNL